MAVVLKCVECGHAIEAESDRPMACPMCEGRMAAPKAKPAAAAVADKDKVRPKPADEKPKAKAKPKPTDDEEEEKPRAKGKAKPKEEPLPLDEEEDDDRDQPGFKQDPAPAKRLGLGPGFKDRNLMRQVAKELKADETLYWVGRQSLPVAKKHALMTAIGGAFFSLVATGILVFMLMDKKMNIPTMAMVVPGIMIAAGLLIAVLGPILKVRQARHGWYALTDHRAIVFDVYPIGKSGRVTNYTPNDLRNTRLLKSFWGGGVGSVVFKTMVKITTRTTTDRRTGRSSTSTSKQVTHYGFLYIDSYEDVGSLLREVIFGGATRRGKDDDEDAEEDED